MSCFLVISLVKAGQRFGGSGGQDFDDSLLVNFTHTHYLSGLIIFSEHEYPWYQFIYRSASDNQSLIVSLTHGNYGGSINSTHTYHLDDDERVDEVTVGFSNYLFGDPNNNHFSTVLIKGLQFRTTKGRTIPPDFPLLNSDIRSERFPGYILGYAAGSSALAIDQLQFVWYRTKK